MADEAPAKTGDTTPKAAFNAAASRIRTRFEEVLAHKMGDERARGVVEKLEQMQIPLPDSGNQFLTGHTGYLMFSNTHGVVIRIETEDTAYKSGTMRINDSAWMLRPIAVVRSQDVLIEVCPGVHYENSDAESRKLYWKMWGDGYHYWDERLDNAGRLPFKSPEFPDGVTVVIDRLSATELSVGLAPIMRALSVAVGMQTRSPLNDPAPKKGDIMAEFRQMMHEVTRWTKRVNPEFKVGVNDPQEILYGDLRRAFLDAWPQREQAPDPEKMAEFWRMVKQHKEDGKLVAGWNEAKEYQYKTSDAKNSADNYEKAMPEPGTIADAILLRDEVKGVMASYVSQGVHRTQKLPDNPQPVAFIEVRTTVEGGNDIVARLNIKGDTVPRDAADRLGLKDISEYYKMPYGLTEADVAGYVQLLDHQIVRGQITEQARIINMNRVWNALEERNPELQGLPLDRAHAGLLGQVITSVAQGYARADIAYGLQKQRDPAHEKELQDISREFGITLLWTPAPETAASIRKQMDEKIGHVLGVEPGGNAKLSAAKLIN